MHLCYSLTQICIRDKSNQFYLVAICTGIKKNIPEMYYLWDLVSGNGIRHMQTWAIQLDKKHNKPK